MRADDSRGQSCYSSPSKASTPEPSSRRSSAGGERPSSARAKARRSPAAAPAGLGGHAGVRWTFLQGSPTLPLQTGKHCTLVVLAVFLLDPKALWMTD